MGNQICCEAHNSKEDVNQLTIVVKHQEEPISLPDLSTPIQQYLQKYQPLRTQLPQNPVVKLYGEDIFEGSVDSKDRPDGYGKMYHKNGSLFIGKFEGGVANGFGHFIKPDGSHYVGNLTNNKANDQNGYYWSEQFEYQGEIFKNLLDGSCIEKSSKHKFIGKYKEGKKVNGKMIWQEDGDQVQYQGQFNERGQPHGKGSIKHPKGTYVGTFSNGKKHGSGTFKFKNGLTYIGDYYNGIKEGQGKLIDTNGKLVYEGSFQNGLPHGQGYVTNKKGQKTKAYWEQGLDKILL